MIDRSWDIVDRPVRWYVVVSSVYCCVVPCHSVGDVVPCAVLCRLVPFFVWCPTPYLLHAIVGAVLSAVLSRGEGTVLRFPMLYYVGRATRCHSVMFLVLVVLSRAELC